MKSYLLIGKRTVEYLHKPYISPLQPAAAENLFKRWIAAVRLFNTVSVLEHAERFSFGSSSFWGEENLSAYYIPLKKQIRSKQSPKSPTAAE